MSNKIPCPSPRCATGYILDISNLNYLAITDSCNKAWMHDVSVVATSVTSCQQGFFKGQFFVDSGIASVVPFVLLSYLLCARRPGGLCPDRFRLPWTALAVESLPRQHGWGTPPPPSSSEQQHSRARASSLAPLEQVIDLTASEQESWQQDP